MQTNAMKACSYIAECSISFTKIMQGERSSKAGKRSFTRLDIAEPKLIFCKDNARRAQQQGGKTQFYQT